MILIIYFAKYITIKLNVQGTVPHRMTSTPYKEFFLLAPTNIPSPLTCLINFRSIKQHISGYSPSWSSWLSKMSLNLPKWPCINSMTLRSKTNCVWSISFQCFFIVIEWTHIIQFFSKSPWIWPNDLGTRSWVPIKVMAYLFSGHTSYAIIFNYKIWLGRES